MKHYNYEDDLSVLYTKFSANRRVQDQVFAELDKIPVLRSSRDVNALLDAIFDAIFKVQGTEDRLRPIPTAPRFQVH